MSTDKMNSLPSGSEGQERAEEQPAPEKGVADNGQRSPAAGMENGVPYEPPVVSGDAQGQREHNFQQNVLWNESYYEQPAAEYAGGTYNEGYG